MAVRPATPDDAPAIAGVFGRAFDDYRRGLGVNADALARLWGGSLAARVDSTFVAVTPGASGTPDTSRPLDTPGTLSEPAGKVVGFVTFVRPGEKERYRSRQEDRRQNTGWWREMGLGVLWRPPLLFIPMGLAYGRRHARKDEMYVSLLGVDPAVQGRGIGQALLAAAADEARACGASAILLHTASTNTRAQASYRRAGYELACTVRAPWSGPASIPAYLALRKPLRPDPTPRLDALGY